MPLSVLDPVVALVVIDLQVGLMAFPTVAPMSDIIDKTAQLARAFRAHNLPVVLVNVDGVAPGRTDSGARQFSAPPGWADLVPELEHQPSDFVVTKRRWGAFIGTDLDDILLQENVTQVVLAGVATSIGVESTARSAYDYGYDVVLVTDAMTDMSEESHRYSLEKVFPRLGETATTETILAALEVTAAP